MDPNQKQKFFDVHSAPPFDTWVWYVEEKMPGKQRFLSQYLVAWVPPDFLQLADIGIWADPVACIKWLDELDTPFVESLRKLKLI